MNYLLLKNTPYNLYKLSNVVEKEGVKKTECDKLVKNVNPVRTINTNDLV